MRPAQTYADKLARIEPQTGILDLPTEQQAFLRDQAYRYRFTLQELRQLVEMATDFAMWNEPSLIDLWPRDAAAVPDKRARQALLEGLRDHWRALKEGPKTYAGFTGALGAQPTRVRMVREPKAHLGLGYCPVASERTRCCNLLTLDAVENCGFDCSYCSIQSFYHGNEIRFDSGFADKLAALELDPDRVYHIGTGQSSDSLMWGNQEGVLDALIAFAAKHPNVILELKTKSKNISHLCRRELPPNLLCTWSLSTQTIIRNEEHHAAPLEDRLAGARRLADRGVLVGFHFHPMVHYDAWREDYGAVFHQLLDGFDPNEVAMVSLGTLTFIKPVIRRIRQRGLKSKILQMPLVESDGKLSYPEATKIELFRHAYRSLDPWHGRVFFYLCMESPRLWRPVLGREYRSNEELEAEMKARYLEKIRARRRKGAGGGLD